MVSLLKSEKVCWGFHHLCEQTSLFSHLSVLWSVGILGGVQVDGREQKQWKIYSFEFKSAYVEK